MSNQNKNTNINNTNDINDLLLQQALYIERERLNQENQILYTVKEVASLLKTNIDYVHSLRKAGLLPFLKLGQYKVRKQALLDFLCKYEGYDLTNPFCVKEI